jgi:hypothetical protein
MKRIYLMRDKHNNSKLNIIYIFKYSDKIIVYREIRLNNIKLY